MAGKLRMGAMSEWSDLKGRLDGKWQIPLMVVSFIMLGTGLLRLRPEPSRLPPEEASHYLDAMISQGLFDRAIELGAALIGQPDYSEDRLSAIHLRLARAKYARAREQRVSTPAAGGEIEGHYRAAIADGVSLQSADRERLGRVLEWQGKRELAIEQYESAIAEGSAHQSDLRKRVITLLLSLPDTPPARLRGMLDELLAEVEESRLDIRIWAIEQELHVLEDMGQLDDATTLLVRNREKFEESDFRDQFAFLEALLLYKAGSYDEAEAYLRTVRNRVARNKEVHASTGWLLGRVVMSDGGPQRPLEALSFFQDVISSDGDSPYAVASRVGMGEALSALERHEEAIDAYRAAVEDLDENEADRVVSRDAVRTSLAVTAELQRQKGDLPAALGYARLAATLIDRRNVEQTTLILRQLAQLQSLRAEESAASAAREFPDGGPDWEGRMRETRALFSEAAGTFVELARINTPDERRAAESSWRAAELYAKAGDLQRAADLYRAFATERPLHTLVPRALLRIGQLEQQMGKLADAIYVFQECYQRFPRSFDGVRALVPLAQCYLASGGGDEELAEKTLRVVLEESDVLTPQAPEFADALFLLGDVLSRRGLYERAIATLEEAIDRYPRDPRVWRAIFVLADSYRRSGLALKEEMSEAKFGGELRQMQAESAARLTKARELYRELIQEYATRSADELTELEKLYLRHAYLYEADCHFEMREYAKALRLYEEAVGLFKDTTSALAAYVQIINCHVFIGKPQEARAALARALILADSIPSQAFSRSLLAESRDDWKRYFEWLGQSELF